MNSNSRNFCFRAIAYLKVEVSSDMGRAVRLNDSDSPVLRGYGNGLRVAYLVDEGDHFSYVQARHLEEAGLSADELHAQGLLNLSVFAEEHITVHEYGTIYTSTGSEFEASMLLCDDFWDVWYAPLAPSGFVVTVPSRSLLAFGDVARPDTIQELCTLYERGSPWKDHPLSASLFKRVGKGWEPLHDGAAHIAPARLQ